MDAEQSEVSRHEAQIYLFVKSQKGWVTSQDVAHGTGVAVRTVQKHMKRLVQLGIFDLAEVFPAHRFRLSSKANRRNVSYLQRLDFACEVFDLK